MPKWAQTAQEPHRTPPHAIFQLNFMHDFCTNPCLACLGMEGRLLEARTAKCDWLGGTICGMT
eukprot:1141965-Pelagomonas_calceolata.AAC.2